ncbi:MAG: FkbM family methyltransferase [Deltaproteobacteria bacterium]|nr:FkbM family methyltransferase [Deltaproteobacteria bacterium]
MAAGHVDSGFDVERQNVTTLTLKEIWIEHVPAGQDVHFLKIDVEGLEESVLRGSDLTKFRPWIVVVEATLPMSQQENYEDWEPILLASGYSFSYADGINRFYVAEEHAELLSAFKYPPNMFFDDCKLSAHQEAETNAQKAVVSAQQAEVNAQQAEVNAQQAEVKVRQAEAKALQALSELQGVYASLSWRITRPLRALARAARRMKASFFSTLIAFKRVVKKILKPILARVIGFILAHPMLNKCSSVFIHIFPMIEARLRRFNFAAPSTITNSLKYRGPTEFTQLSPSARRIHADLKAAVKQHDKERH